MARPCALGALTFAALALLVACAVRGPAAELVFAVLAVAFPSILMVVGAAGPGGRLGSAAWPIATLLLVLEACLIGMLALRGQVEAGVWLLGLPAAGALQLYGLLLLPQALVALGYAQTFDSFGVSDRELDSLRALSRQPPEAPAAE